MKTLAELNTWSEGHLPEYLGIVIEKLEDGELHAVMPIASKHHAPNGYLHAGAVVSLADTACGYGCISHLPEGASGFTTMQLNSQHVGTAMDGTLRAVAKLIHRGRTSQVWDATVTEIGSGRVISHFRCTQLILYPKT
ncbi:MAG: PaaI family thioesterase [Burkholderiales bacterium]|nr:PaaI family thioesterase [Burkholderiales bacterium]